MHVGQRFKRDIRIDRACAITNQQAEVMRFARFAGFDDQPALRSSAFADEVVMNRRRRQQAGDRSFVAIDTAVTQDDNRCAFLHRQADSGAHFINRLAKANFAVAGVEQHRNRHRTKITLAHFPKLREIGVAQNRLLQLDQVAMLRRLIQQVPFAAQIRIKRRHQALKVRIQRRIRHLREELLKIVV